MTNLIREYDHLYKSVIVGNSGVGKSCLLIRFAEGHYDETYLSTIGVDFKFMVLLVDGKNVKFQIWDTAGQERFRTITSAYYKGSHGILLVFDLTDKKSFDDIDRFWRAEVESYAEKEVAMYLVGNKADMADRREVDRETAEKYAEGRGMVYFECSAKEDDNVADIFLDFARRMMKKEQDKAPKKPQNVQVKNTKADEKKDSKCC